MVVLSTMSKRNSIHVLLLLLVTLASYVSAEHFYIVPNGSTSQCQNYSAGTCFTLAEFDSNSNYHDQDNLTLSFLPGQHLLTRRLTITGPQNITVMGQNSSNSLSTIKCQGTSGFDFGDIQSLNIEHLEFTGCGNVTRGGAIYIHRADNILIRGCHFTDNHVVGNRSRGGVICVENTVAINIKESYFDNNYAYGLFSDGGAIYVSRGIIISTNVYYTNNSAGNEGGAIFVLFGNINSTNDQYTNNSASYYGGAIYMYDASGDDTKLSGANFEHNSAFEGAVIYQNGGALVISQSNVTGNFASSKNTVHMNSGQLALSERVNFMNNRGSLYVFNTKVELKGIVAFISNFGDSGGAITAFLSEISFNTASTVTIFNNTATNGGGMSLTQSSLHVYHSIELIGNHPTDFGGGIYAYQSVIEFKPEQKQRSDFTKNTASNGGAVCAIASNIHISNTYMEVS